MQLDLTARLALGERIAEARRKEQQRVIDLRREVQAYELHLALGGYVGEGSEYAEMVKAWAALTGCDHCHDLGREVSTDGIDLFGNPVHSMQARAASIAFDMSKEA